MIDRVKKVARVVGSMWADVPVVVVATVVYVYISKPLAFSFMVGIVLAHALATARLRNLLEQSCEVMDELLQELWETTKLNAELMTRQQHKTFTKLLEATAEDDEGTLN